MLWRSGEGQILVEKFLGGKGVASDTAAEHQCDRPDRQYSAMLRLDESSRCQLQRLVEGLL
jgi:hypothetical protein